MKKSGTGHAGCGKAASAVITAADRNTKAVEKLVNQTKERVNELLEWRGCTLDEKEWLLNAFSYSLADGVGYCQRFADVLEEHFFAVWCDKQREDYSAGQLTPEQVKKLEAIPGWTWETSEGGDAEKTECSRRQ